MIAWVRSRHAILIHSGKNAATDEFEDEDGTISKSYLLNFYSLIH